MSRTNGTENHDSLLHGPCKTFVVTVHEDVYDKDVDFEMISSIVDSHRVESRQNAWQSCNAPFLFLITVHTNA